MASPGAGEDRAALREQLHGLSHLGLYAVFIAIPGSSMALPLFAWWLDQRARRREPDKSKPLEASSRKQDMSRWVAI